MTWFAHIETGKFLDVREAQSVEEYRAAFPGADTSSWRIVVTADASVEGSDAPLPDAAPKILSKTAFRKYAASQIAGGGMAGMARVEEILKAARTSENGVVNFCAGQYDAADTFEISEVVAFSEIMRGAEIMSADEQAAIVKNWPKD